MKHSHDRRSERWPEAWGELADAYGGPRALAAELGKHRQTIWRWALRGDRVPASEAELIRILASRKGKKSPV